MAEIKILLRNDPHSLRDQGIPSLPNVCNATRFNVGEQVLAKYRGGYCTHPKECGHERIPAGWYRGKISRVGPNGTYEIEWDELQGSAYNIPSGQRFNGTGDQMTLKRSWGRLEHRNRSTLLILELCGMREQGVWGVDTITRLSEILSPFSVNILKIFRKFFGNFSIF